MELKDKKNIKYIINRKLLPGFNMGYLSAVGPGIDAVGSIYGSFNNYYKQDELEAMGDTRTGYAGNVAYQYTNPTDGSLIMKEANANVGKSAFSGLTKGFAAGISTGNPLLGAAGAIIGGIGGLFGGLTSKDKQEAAIRRANIALHNKNDFNFARAASENQRLENAKKGYVNAGVLSGYADGKIPSAHGMVDANATAKVSNGEVIADEQAGVMYRVPGKKNMKDGNTAYVKDRDDVFTNGKNEYGESISDFIWRTGDIQGAREMLKERMIRMNEYKCGKNAYKCGKLPKLINGQIANAISAGTGALGGIMQYLDAKNQTLKRYNSFIPNKYEREVSDILSNLRMSSLPIINQYRSAEARAMDAIRNSGGLNAGQRALARIAALSGTLQNIGNLYTANQQQNNAYRQFEAQTRNNMGQWTSEAEMRAKQWDEDMYAREHANRLKRMDDGLFSVINNVQEGLKGAYNISLFDKQYNMLAQEQKRKDSETAAYISALKGNNKTNIQKATPIISKSSAPNINSWVDLNGKLVKGSSPITNVPSKSNIGIVADPHGSQLKNNLVYDSALRSYGRYGYDELNNPYNYISNGVLPYIYGRAPQYIYKGN